MAFFTRKSNGGADDVKPATPAPAATATNPFPPAAPAKPAAVTPAASPPAAAAKPTAAAVANGAAGAPAAAAPELPAAELAKRKAFAKHMSSTFGEIVSLMMRQPGMKHQSLADLEWMVLPALMANQFSLVEAQSKTQGNMAPVGVVLWARVSPEIDKRLSAQLEGPLRLAPAEWTSGDTIWLIEAIGEKRVIGAILQKLRSDDWLGNTVKIRARGADGKVAVKSLEPAAAAKA